MAVSPKSEDKSAPSHPSASAETEQAEPQLPLKTLAGQKRTAELLAHTNELLLSTARVIWEDQSNLLRHEMEQLSKSCMLFQPGTDIGAAAGASYDRWHDETERLVSHVRRTGDLLRECGWQLLTLHRDNAQDMIKQLPSFPFQNAKP